MKTMLALQQTANGGLSTFKLGQFPRPSPGPGEVLLRVHAASINPVDIKRSSLNVPDKFPVVVGYDVAGVVESIGADVTRFKPGDRVFGDVMADSLGPKVTGSVAEYCVCRADLLAMVPAGCSLVEAAALPVVAETAIVALRLGGAKSGDKVFVTGGAGGVGVHLIQLAKNMFDIGEIATTASAAKSDFVKKYGADRVVDYHNEDAGATFNGWADIVIDNTAEVDMERRIVKKGGKIVSIVNVNQPDVIAFLIEPTQALIEEVAHMWAQGKLQPVVDTVYPMAEAVKAVEHVAGGHAKGKVIIKVLENA